MKNNPVFQVLVVTQPTLIAADNDLDALAVGQLGIFDASTNKSVAHDAALPNKFFFAVGLANQLGTLGDIRKSSGDYIPKALLERVDSQEYVAPENKVFSLDLTGYTPANETDYVLRFTLFSGQTMNLSGYTHPVKSFVITTDADATLAELKAAIIAEVNKDPEGLIVAANATGDILTFTVGGEDETVVINGINRRYNYLRQFNGTLALSEGFEDLDSSKLTATGPVYEQGSGYDIKQEEYVAGGWIGNPGVYRSSMLNGILQSDIKIYADEATNYWVMRFKYNEHYTSGGSLQYDSTLETVIAIPQTAANFTLINQLITMVNTYLPNDGDTTAVTTTSTTTTTTTTGA